MPRKPAGNPDTTQRELILNAALGVFSREGFEGASVREIARIADCNHAMIRYYFDTKDKLWREAVRFLFERMKRELAIDPALRIAFEKGDRDAFETMVHRYVRYCALYPEHSRIMTQATIRDDDRLQWAIDQFVAPLQRMFARGVKGLIKQQVIAKTDPLHAGFILVAACQTIFTMEPELRRLHGRGIDETMARRHAESVLKMLMCPA